MIYKETGISRQVLIAHLKVICGDRYVFTDAEDIYLYARDQTMDLHFAFDILVKPETSREISSIMQLCNTYNIPVTPRGGGSGVTGGALPVCGGIVLSMERMNRIIEINEPDGTIIAESGVVTADLCRAVQQAGFYFPVEPSSSSYSFIGGNVAENAGSMRSCKYGKTGEYVLNLEVVLATGEIIWTGRNVKKNSTGLNITQLFVGSEGILGIITKVVYRLLPQPGREVLLLAGFRRLGDACEAVIAFKHSGLGPSAMELICRNALDLTAAYLRQPIPLLHEHIAAHLLIWLEEDGDGGRSMSLAAAILEKYTKEDILMADTPAEREKLAGHRFRIGDAMTNKTQRYRDIDICVPLSFLHRYIMGVEEICAKKKVDLACFGHAMDGNMHAMLLFDDPGKKEDEAFRSAVYEIYRYAIENGGSISGEHGIGLLQKEFMELQFSKEHLDLMVKLKLLFDPNGILNQGKLLPLRAR